MGFINDVLFFFFLLLKKAASLFPLWFVFQTNISYFSRQYGHFAILNSSVSSLLTSTWYLIATWLCSLAIISMYWSPLVILCHIINFLKIVCLRWVNVLIRREFGRCSIGRVRQQNVCLNAYMDKKYEKELLK